MATIGYARVSTLDQSLDMQLFALRSHGCDDCYCDHGWSGSQFKRPGLEEALAALSEGDVFIVWRLDRLGRSIIDLIQFVEALEKRSVHFRSLTESIDTASPGGRFFFHMIAALAEFERQLIRERTVAGLLAARMRGAQLGRPCKVTPAILGEARSLLDLGMTINEISNRVGLSSRSLRRYLNVNCVSKVQR